MSSSSSAAPASAASSSVERAGIDIQNSEPSSSKAGALQRASELAVDSTLPAPSSSRLAAGAEHVPDVSQGQLSKQQGGQSSRETTKPSPPVASDASTVEGGERIQSSNDNSQLIPPLNGTSFQGPASSAPATTLAEASNSSNAAPGSSKRASGSNAGNGLAAGGLRTSSSSASQDIGGTLSPRGFQDTNTPRDLQSQSQPDSLAASTSALSLSSQAAPSNPHASQHSHLSSLASTSSATTSALEQGQSQSSHLSTADKLEGNDFQSSSRPASLLLPPLKVRDYGFQESDPRHVGARDVSRISDSHARGGSGYKASRIGRFDYDGGFDDDDEEEAELGTVNWQQSSGDEWGPGASYDEDEDEFEGDQGQPGAQENVDSEIHPGPYRVIYDFEAEEEHELSVKAGDRVTVVGAVEGGWAAGSRDADGKEGLVPAGYLEAWLG
ncbi:unnamed protein product [Jaminaea pallidilutea]